MSLDEGTGSEVPPVDTEPQTVKPSALTVGVNGAGAHELLRLGLEQAVAVLGGLGCMLHLGVLGSGSLYLVASSGLPGALVREWAEIGREEQVPAARAVRESTAVWMPADAPGDAGVVPGRPYRGTGILSVPLTDPGGPQGAVSVVTSAPGEPGIEAQRLLGAVTEWATDWLRRCTAVPGAADSAWYGYAESLTGPEAMVPWGWDFTDGVVLGDRSALGTLGLDQGTFDGRIGTWRRLVHPWDLPPLLARMDEAIRARSAYSLEYRQRGRDGSFRRLEACGYARTQANSTSVRLIGTLRDITGSGLAPSSVSRALLNMSDGLLAVDRGWRITFANPGAERLFDPSGALPGRLLWEAVPDLLDSRADTCRQALDDGRPVAFDLRRPADGRWLHVRLVPVPEGLTLSFSDVTRVRRLQDQQDAERTARIAELTRALASAVTGRDVVDVVDAYMLPLFGADGVGVWVQERERIFAVGTSGYPAEFVKRIEGTRVEDTPPVAQALIDRVPNFIPSAEEFIRRYPAMADIPAADGKKAWAMLPLVASGRSVGCCTLSFERPHAFTQEERTLLTVLSGLVAQALERARLYDAEHGRAQELQRGLLPRTLPSLPAVTAAARYLPAGEGMEVGGDWYDVIPLSADRVALVIGDVMGHGLSEAVTMGRLRTAVRTLADLELPPDEMFIHLNDMVNGLGDDFYATCLYAVYDPTSRLCSLTTAGHPPPAVVHPDGTARFPDLPLNPPLGAADPPFDTAVIELPEDSLLVLYTDGLVESPDRTLDRGMAHLAQNLCTAQRSGTADPKSLCDCLIAALLPDPQRALDDTALLVARTHASAPADLACWPLPTDPKAAGQARHRIRDQLDAWDLQELAMPTELIVSELVGNVVRHAKGPVMLRLLRSRTLICELADGSASMPRIRRAADMDEGGRGLQLIAALTDRWGARYTPSGKCIWTEQSLPTAQ
ncbi:MULTISPECIES: SpoIIE family protein phosphatase [unclassified Streptomyces]|uniref:SpoIIE family protein phosphatase n=1 Tax=unclassified Streptomyces TaxID=2593676 RepID=UPI002252CF41|nr:MULTISPECIES: SpoIIE family protein phosphatase [unclassified Streptomyces]MCX4406006.1 SpoIIE family protein phosphatase [Streptomyces sp. NBC_01764]MCX5189470.1 SpoIIE family protein phosphatase [Streptomyces sp. NBC_00268]